ncbi:hypothetical protein BDR26DRAFT_858256, partial [Obelidium mucronatum]
MSGTQSNLANDPAAAAAIDVEDVEEFEMPQERLSASLAGDHSLRPNEPAQEFISSNDPEIPPEIPSERTIVALSLNYNCANGKFLEETFPVQLQDLIPNYIYCDRIVRLNRAIRGVTNLRDTSPHIRTVLLGIFIVSATILLQLNLSTASVEIWFGLILFLLVSITWTYFRSFAYDRAVDFHLMSFNELDSSTQLIWSQKNQRPPMISFTDWGKRIELSRDILIEFVKKASAPTESLPVYVFEERCSFIERCPSYRETV